MFGEKGEARQKVEEDQYVMTQARSLNIVHKVEDALLPVSSS